MTAERPGAGQRQRHDRASSSTETYRPSEYTGGLVERQPVRLVAALPATNDQTAVRKDSWAGSARAKMAIDAYLEQQHWDATAQDDSLQQIMGVDYFV